MAASREALLLDRMGQVEYDVVPMFYWGTSRVLTKAMPARKSVVSQKRLQAIAVGLISCLLLLSGSFFYQIPSHLVHHAHHNAATHGSVLCSWMCATAEPLDTVDINLEVRFFPVQSAEFFSALSLPLTPPARPTSRAPPSFSA